MMAKLVLLNLVLFLLVAVGNSIAWPSYSDEAQRQDALSDELERENRHAMENSYFDEAKIDTYDEDADTADDEVAMADDNLAEINRRRRGRGRKRPKKPR